MASRNSKEKSKGVFNVFLLVNSSKIRVLGQARRNEKNSGGLAVYPKKMLPKLISRLRRSFN